LHRLVCLDHNLYHSQKKSEFKIFYSKTRFQRIFDQKHCKNTNTSWLQKKSKETPKKLKSTRIQKSTITQICYPQTLKVKKTSNINFTHQMKTM